jgi:hypothetical protein
LLNGKIRRGWQTPSDTRQETGWPEPHVTDKKWAYDLIELFAQIAKELDWSIPRVVISWILDRPGVDGTVIAARKFDHLTEDLDAAELTLPAEARDRITAASQLACLLPALAQNDDSARTVPNPPRPSSSPNSADMSSATSNSATRPPRCESHEGRRNYR